MPDLLVCRIGVVLECFVDYPRSGVLRGFGLF